MRKLLVISTVLTVITTVATGQELDLSFKHFLKPRPVRVMIDTTVVANTEMAMDRLLPGGATVLVDENRLVWEFKPLVQIPAIRLTESVRENAKVDATFLASAGGGITFQRSALQDDGRWGSTFGVSAVVLIAGDTSQDVVLDFSVGLTLGFFNNLIQVGAGYDLGQVNDRSRLFGLLSAGINLTSN